MAKYDFTVVLKGGPELSDELADKLFAAGCDDGSPGMCAGQTVIDFHRDADSLEAAIRSAVASVASAGCTVERVQLDASDLAARA
jgi:hypothetical protein